MSGFSQTLEAIADESKTTMNVKVKGANKGSVDIDIELWIMRTAAAMTILHYFGIDASVVKESIGTAILKIHQIMVDTIKRSAKVSMILRAKSERTSIYQSTRRVFS